MTRARPLRFLALTLGGWVTLRMMVLWPWTTVPIGTPPPAIGVRRPLIGADQPRIEIASAARLSLVDEARGPAAAMPLDRNSAAPRAPVSVGRGLPREDAPGKATPEQVRLRADRGSPDAATIAAVRVTDTSTPTSLASDPSRAASAAAFPLHGGTWLIARPVGGDSLAFGQLGASQAGMRVTYAVDAVRGIDLSARVSAPLRGVGREAALGVDVQPSRLPVHLLIEQRLPLDGGPARPAAQLIGGAVAHLPLHLVADGYAQAGGVYRRGAFADGSARLSRALLRRSRFVLDLGAGAWGAAQRRVARLDLGPAFGLTLPARGGTVRLAVDYRLRVAGRARPGSGPAVSLGSSF